MPYTTGPIEVNFLTCEADHVMDCGFTWCSSEVLLSCDGAVPAPHCCPGCCSTGRAVRGLWARGNWERAGLGWEELGVVTQGQQSSVGSTCTGAWEGTAP